MYSASCGCHVKELTWHPQIAEYMILVKHHDITDPGPDSLQWLDIRDGSFPLSRQLPIKVTGIGPGEGIPSNDGTKLALISATRDSAVLVDMSRSEADGISVPLSLDSQYPCGLCGGTGACAIGSGSDGGGHVSVSSKGTYLDVAYKSDFHRIFDINWASTPPAITGPHPMAAGSRRCYSAMSLQSADGWIMPLKHPDLVTYGG